MSFVQLPARRAGRPTRLLARPLLAHPMLTKSLTASALLLAAGAAFAQQPPPADRPERPGRYTMQPVEGGFLRLDTETGAVSLCTRQGGSFACEGVKDERDQLRAEADRLRSENRELRSEVERLQKGAAAPDAAPDGGRRGGGLKLPSERELDEAMDTLERLYKKFRDRMKRLEREGDRGQPL